MGDITNIFNNMIFPAAAFIVCAWFLKYVYDRSLTMYDKSLDKLGTLADAINNNTKVLADLVEEEKRNHDK